MNNDRSDDLPEGWAWSNLGELGTWASGGTPTTGEDAYWDHGTILWISAKDMKSEFLDTSIDLITEKGREAARLTLLPAGSVLMVVRGMILARAFPVAVTTAPATINQDLRALIPHPGVESSFLLRALQAISPGVLHATGEATHGTRRLESDMLKSWPIPLPPSVEQRRIMGAVSAVFAKVTSARERLDRALTTMKRFRHAVLTSACSGQLTASWRSKHSRFDASSEQLPQHWRLVKVSDVIEGLKYGTSKKCESDGKGTPVLRIPNVSDGVICHDDMKYAELERTEAEQLKLLPGDLLMIRSNGSVSLLGKTALVGPKEEGFTYAGYLIRLRPKTAEVYSPYLHAALSSQAVRNQIEMPARSTSGVNNINSDEVRDLEFALPPLEEQEEIVRRVTALFALTDSFEQRAKSALKRVETLTQAVLTKACRGELVPTEAELARRERRPYESADQLLVRIRSTPANSGITKRSRKARPSKSAESDKRTSP